MEYQLVETWLRRDPVRWVAGLFSGLFAGVVAMIFAMGLCSFFEMDPWFPAKLLGTILIGPTATEYTNTHGALLGFILFESLCAFWGFVFAHFVKTNSFMPLLGMGLTWAAFSWIFIWNLFMQSFPTIYAANVSSGPVFFVCLVYGISLTSVAVFDKIFRMGQKKPI